MKTPDAMREVGDKELLGIIPARGGSKSIPRKNIALLSGRPLIAYVIHAGKRSRSVRRAICSTDDVEIGNVCRGLGIEVMDRPKELAQDDTHVIEVIIDVLKSLKEKEGYTPWAVALLQPTSPFLLPEHIDESMSLLLKSPNANSAQTVASFPHNYHAYNQRVIEGGTVRFRFSEERAACYNKQSKPKFYVFGNLVITRTEALLGQKEIFAQPSLPLEIPYPCALDVDGPSDLDLAEWYLQTGKVIPSVVG